MRLPTAGGLLPWEFSRDGKVLKVRVEGQLTINALHHRIEAARAGMGLVYIPEDSVAREIATGELIACWTSGVSRSRDIISTTLVADSTPPRFRCYAIALTDHACSVAMSITKRYFTSLFNNRS